MKEVRAEVKELTFWKKYDLYQEAVKKAFDHPAYGKLFNLVTLRWPDYIRKRKALGLRSSPLTT